MRSIWQDIPMPSFPPLAGDTRTDVLIIGGGIAGLLTAHYLKESGVRCLLVEKGRICGGVTQNTTAKINVQQGLVYHKLLKRYGEETAVGFYAANTAALEEYAKLAETFPCDFERKTNYVYSLKNTDLIEKELSALDRIGAPGDFEESLLLPLPTVGAVKTENQAQFHPLKFLSALASPLPILENTAVLAMENGAAVTSHGRIYADRIVVATHFPFINKHGLYFLKLYQHRSYVLALQNAPDYHGMYIDEARCGLSFRNAQGELLLGGGGMRPGKKGKGWEVLRAFASKHYPEAEETHAWATQDCMSLDGMPYIGLYGSSTPALYVATGFNKWGMTGAMAAALLLRDLLLDKDNPYTALFSPARSLSHPQLALNSMEAAADLLTPGRRRCPHMGCALHWNAEEQTWDCPCHGSRFTADGKVLDNPANGDMTPGWSDPTK